MVGGHRGVVVREWCAPVYFGKTNAGSGAKNMWKAAERNQEGEWQESDPGCDTKDKNRGQAE